MAIRLYAHNYIKEALGDERTQDLLTDFRLYKEEGKLPLMFGRDAPYDFTHNRTSLELRHIHIKENPGFMVGYLYIVLVFLMQTLTC